LISLEQVQLLETRVSKAVEYVQKITAENKALASEKDSLQKKLEVNQKRIDELEVHVMRFKEEQGRIEDGIIAALDRLSQFEEAFQNSLKDDIKEKKPASKSKTQEEASVSKEIFFEIPENENEPSDGNQSSEGELDIF